MATFNESDIGFAAVLDASDAPARSSTAAIEVHAKELQLPAWELAALKAYMKWPIGKVVSSTDFDAALKTVRSQRFGY